MRMYKVLPDLKSQRQLDLWEKGLASQWSARDMAWNEPLRMSEPARDTLARILTPILIGEQSAFYSVSQLIPQFGKRGEVESQFFMTTWAVDEARHTELFTRYYHRLEREPLSIKRFAPGYLFQSSIKSDEPAEWLAGVLVSETLAKISLEEFRRVDVDPVLSQICDGILKDEARHLAFNRIYMDERIREVIGLDEDPRALLDLIQSRRDLVFGKAESMFRMLAVELEELGVHWEDLNDRLDRETSRYIEMVARGAGVETVGAASTEDAAE